MRSQWSLTLQLPDGSRVFKCETLQRRGTRSMRLRLRNPETLFLSCPPRTSLKVQQRFIEQQVEWIAACLAQRPSVRTLAEHLADNPLLAGPYGPVSVTLGTNSPRSMLRFPKPWDNIHFALDERGHVWQRDLKYLLQKYAASILPIRVKHWVNHHQLDPAHTRVSVRDQSSRWGSCSQKRTLSLNWRLVLLPQEVADYIILHELAHLREMNHSARFWNHLRHLDPATDSHEDWLRVSGSSIIAMARED